LRQYFPTKELPFVYNLATVFVYPSIYEGFGLPPLEAMACGVPVITTSVSAMPEYLAGAEILVPPENQDALTQAIEGMISNRELRKDLATKGLQRARLFPWKKTAETTLQNYRYMLQTAAQTLN
jgi:glycosyltransferase involved in cell wall biosynthesis